MDPCRVVLKTVFIILAFDLCNSYRHFMLGFMRSKQSTKDLSISILNPDPLFSALVNVRSHWSMNTNQSFSLESRADHTFTPSVEFEVTMPGVTHKGILITSDRPILVSGTNRADHGTYSYADSYQAIPMEALGTSYYAVTAAEKGEILVVSGFDRTMVTITVKGLIYHNDKEYRSGDLIIESLDQYGTLLLYSSGSLTGTHISSDKVITVYSGNQYVSLGGSSNFLVQQLAPVHRWSSAIHMLIPRPATNVDVIIVAAYSDTVASIVCDELNFATNTTLPNAGSSYLSSVRNFHCTVSSNQAVSVTVILTGSGFDPVMIRIQPVVELTSTRSGMFLVHSTDFSNVLVLFSRDTANIVLNDKEVSLRALQNGFCTAIFIESKVNEIKCKSNDCWISAYIHAILLETKEAVGFPLHFIEMSNDEETTPIFQVTTDTDQEREVTHGDSLLPTTLWSLVTSGTTPSTRHSSPNLPIENDVTTADPSKPTVSVNNVVATQWTTPVPTETTNPSVLTATTKTASVLNQSCACYGRSCQKSNYTREELENLIEELKQELMVKKKATSSHLRTLNSAPDHRTSSKVAGYMAGVILVTLAVGLLILDIPNLLSTLNTIRSNLCGTKPS